MTSLSRSLMTAATSLCIMACSSASSQVPANPADSSGAQTAASQPTNMSKDNPNNPVIPIQVKTDAIALSNLETWYEDIANATDTATLETAFQRHNYDPGRDAYAFIAKITPHENGTITYRFFSYRDSAFVFSLTEEGEERFWPASTVKLTAAVMALLRAQSLGIAPNDKMTFVDLGVKHQTTLKTLVDAAIIPSDNEAYNSLMLFTGLDRANDVYIRNVFHFPTMVLQRRYHRKDPKDNLRYSPTFTFQHGDETITVPEETSTHYFAHVPREANATTLIELAEMMRRVMTRQWLALSDENFDILQNALLQAPSCIGDGVSKAHPNFKIYNKGGRVIGDDRLEIAYITDEKDIPQYLLALSLPYSDSVEQRTQEFAWHLITAVDESL